MFKNLTTIKSIITKRYEITLLQSNAGLYYVEVIKKDQQPDVSESMDDLNTALFVFDIKIEELEGN